MRCFVPAMSTVLFCCLTAATACRGQEQDERLISVANEQIQMTVPSDWKRKDPSFNIIEYEFVIQGKNSPADDGRLTMMGAGGTIDANVDRWKSQFVMLNEGQAQVEQRTIADREVHVVDIRGTFKPRGAGPHRENHRMLAAVIVTPNDGRYFVKLTGPDETVTGSEASFFQFLDSMASN